MRTQEEIAKKMKDIEKEDFFGTIRSDLVEFLDFEHAKQYLKDGATHEQWDNIKKENTVEVIKKEMSSYLSFAVEKAENERGLSAARSMDHYYAWIWLLGEEERFGDVRKYSGYGMSNLLDIKEFLKS